MANTENIEFIKGKLQSSELESFRSSIYIPMGCFVSKGNKRVLLNELDAEFNKANPKSPLGKGKHVDMEQQCIGEPTRAWKPIGHSGYTVATGFDISRHNLWELKKMGFKGVLFRKLSPFASDYSGVHPESPPQFTNDELKEIDQKVMTYKIHKLATRFDIDTKSKKFADLNQYYQTVLYSLYHQYQNGLFKPGNKINKVYLHAINGDWTKLSEELNNMDDGYPERRKAEGRIAKDGIKAEPVK